VRNGAPLRYVPVETLAAALALPDGLGADVAEAAQAYQPHVEADIAAADRAVARLVSACGGVADEATAARIGLLVQACDATAGLVDRAFVAASRQHGATPDDLLAAVLRDDPPVRATRRLVLRATRVGSTPVPAGAIVSLDLTGDAQLPFGSGLRPCPGRAHALALAAGTLEAVV
jgi:cytochrome P450